MKAQVVHNYDKEMKKNSWVKQEELPNPKIEKSTDINGIKLNIPLTFPKVPIPSVSPRT